MGDLPEELLLCLVQALRTYLAATASLAPHPCSLFMSPRFPLRFLSMNTLSYFLHHVISSARTRQDDQPSLSLPHSIRGVATLAAFLCNWSISKVLEAATWRLNPVLPHFIYEMFIFLQMIFTPSGHLSQRAPWCSDSVVIFMFVVLFQFVSLLWFPWSFLPIRRYPVTSV